MGAIPERDAGPWEKIRDRHHGRPDNPKSVLDPVALERFDERLFGGHFHGKSPDGGLPCGPAIAPLMSLKASKSVGPISSVDRANTDVTPRYHNGSKRESGTGAAKHAAQHAVPRVASIKALSGVFKIKILDQFDIMGWRFGDPWLCLLACLASVRLQPHPYTDETESGDRTCRSSRCPAARRQQHAPNLS